MNARSARVLFMMCLALVWHAAPASAQVANVKVVTDASPDYYDMDSLIRSITSKWATP